jgi:hypothetical protein
MAQVDVSFAVSKWEMDVITEIAQRGELMAVANGDRQTTRMDIMMDLCAVVAQGCSLRLIPLRDADDFDFAHDVFGIRKHLDRETGTLQDHFWPRFAAHKGNADA